jgi:hypothetical protein
MRYVSRAKHLVFLPLNTGDTVHLAPGEVSRQLEPYETDQNRRLERLVRLGVVAVAESASEATKGRTGKSARGRFPETT